MVELTDHVKKICRWGLGSTCCRYIEFEDGLFRCAKVDVKKKLMVDMIWTITKEPMARGDNCAGMTNLEALNKKQR